jgi:hypothetical protein
VSRIESGGRRAAGGLIAIALTAAVATVGACGPRRERPAGAILDGALECTSDGSVRVCGGEGASVESFDGTPIEVTVAMPDQGGEPFPLLLSQGGWPAGGFDGDALRPWASGGYAVVSISNRGLGGSGGATRFMDTRYEVRDAQEVIGLLVDDEVADPERLGAFGGSYGAGQALALAAMRNRVMLPDGELSPWRSPEGQGLSLTAAVSLTGWSDLADAFLPNGSSLTFTSRAPYEGPVGPLKESALATLYEAGVGAGVDYGPPGVSSFATWYQRLVNRAAGGEPSPEAIAAEMSDHHSAATIEGSVPPAATLLISGLADDLFPADQAISWINQVRAEHPGTPVAGLIADVGHARSEGEEEATRLAQERAREWLDHHLLEEGDRPATGLAVAVEDCADGEEELAEASDPAALAPGEIRLADPKPRRIPADVPEPRSAALSPGAAEGPCAEVPAQAPAGAAAYALPPTGEGFTLAGAPLVTARFEATERSQVAALLFDVDPEGSARLVARGVWMPGGGRRVFELAPTGWRFAPGHAAQMQLLPADPGYGQLLPGQSPVTVRDLELRLPVLEQPGTDGGAVREPAPKPLPPGYELAPGYR